jgi:hypothetical protein
MTSGSVTRRYKNRQFRFLPEELNALKQRAEADGLSEAEVLRKALRAYLGLRCDAQPPSTK